MAMNAYSEQIKNPKVVGVGAFIIGLLIGWMVLGWWVFPVKWVDAPPELLQAGYQEDYLRAAVDSFQVNNDVNLAQARYGYLGEYGAETLARIQTNPQYQDPAAVQAFAAAVSAPEVPPVEGQATEVPPTGGEEGGGPPWLIIILIMCLLTLGVGAALFYFLAKGSQGGYRSSGTTTRVDSPPMTEFPQEDQPLAQYMATYRAGDDLFDDSFSVDSAQGEFLGECGVGISETIGVGDPKKVAAFEVWLFDKNDIQTVTKVLMSAHTFDDETARQRMAAKGEPYQAEIGKEVVLETQSLQLVARVADMAYGEGALPTDSFFDQFVIELAVWEKE